MDISARAIKYMTLLFFKMTLIGANKVRLQLYNKQCHTYITDFLCCLFVLCEKVRTGMRMH